MKNSATTTGLTKSLRYFYGVGDMFFALMTSVYSYYLTFYYTNVAMLSLGTIAILVSVTSAFDSATSWIYGAIINSTKPMKWGRYRSWLIILTWLMPVTSFLLYCRIGKSEIVATVFFFIAMIVSRIVQNFPYTANVALINVVGKTPDDRIQLASSRATWNNASKFLWSFVSVPFLAVLISVVSERYAYATLAAILSVGTVLGYYAHFRMTKDYEDTGMLEQANAAKAKRAKTKPLDLIRALFTNPPLLALIIADLAKWLFNSMVAGTVVYYFTYIALNRDMQATYTLIIAFTAVIGAYSSRFIGKKLSGRKTMILIYLLMAACMLVARLFYTNMWTVIILVSAAQLGYGCVYSCSAALYGDTAIYSEWKTGKNSTGWIMGLINLPIKIASFLKGIILPAALAVGGFSAAVAAEAAPEAMRVAIADALLTIPGALLVFGALVMIFLYRLPKERVVQMQQEIEEKKAAEEAQAAQA